ncbi:hypothetical protein [Listeria monocytogenes]|nr:hypothetical protein [Listeria monocytogenes]
MTRNFEKWKALFEILELRIDGLLRFFGMQQELRWIFGRGKQFDNKST